MTNSPATRTPVGNNEEDSDTISSEEEDEAEDSTEVVELKLEAVD